MFILIVSSHYFIFSHSLGQQFGLLKDFEANTSNANDTYLYYSVCRIQQVSPGTNNTNRYLIGCLKNMSDLDNISEYLWGPYGSPMAAIQGGAMVDWVCKDGND